jgi:hypothetical protein
VFVFLDNQTGKAVYLLSDDKRYELKNCLIRENHEFWIQQKKIAEFEGEFMVANQNTMEQSLHYQFVFMATLPF